MGNPYITAKRGEFDALRSTIEGIQRKASDEKRDLTEDELRSIKDQGDQARKIADEVTMLAEIDTRSAAVAQLGAQVDETATAACRTRPLLTATPVTTAARPKVGLARSSRTSCVRRKTTVTLAIATEHHRALSSSSAGTGTCLPSG